MLWIIYIILIVTTIEIARLLDFKNFFLSYISDIKTIKLTIISKEISDERKQQILLSNSLNLLKLSTKLTINIIVVFAPVIIVVLIDFFYQFNFANFLLKTNSLVFAIVFAFLYSKVRFSYRNPKSDYSLTSKLFHKLFLGNSYLPKIMFDLEKSLYLTKSRSFNRDQHIFITGLARSGTTILLNLLHQSNLFASLTYQDMPLVLSPNLWSQLTSLNIKSQKPSPLIQRAHQDRIKINNQSPEALDEVFWRVFTGKQYIKNNTLSPYLPDYEIIEEYNNYISLVLGKYQKQHYLSKNNNNILRLDSLIQHFPKSLFLITFRDPIQHANSLFKQHNKFSNLQKTDPFVADYMNFLNHHEFGLHHKPFDFPNLYKELPKDSIDYWLQIWVSYYQYFLENYQNKSPQIIFLNYEKFCLNPSQIINKISQKISVDLSQINVQILKASQINEINIQDNELRNNAYEIHKKLKEFSNN